ncbi:MAG: IS3 family transposase [Candidatus Omnitrophica bacterium]|nr:IS3 family transposase [Candidatus Omnitrophota bacterium]
MSGKRLTEEQIIPILKRHEAGTSTQDLCREVGVSTATLYKWKAKYGGLEISDARRLKGLEEENRKLKRLVADQALEDIQAYKEIARGKLLKPKRRRKAAEHLVRDLGLKKAKASKVTGMARSGHYYQFKLRHEESGIVNRMKALIEQQNTIGCEMMHEVLMREELLKNHKRTERIYKEQGFSLKIRKRKRRISQVRLELPKATRPNQRWSMDFMHCSLWSSRKFRLLCLIGQFTKECPVIEVDYSLPGLRVTRALEWLLITRQRPEAITVDNGPEFAGKALDQWAYKNKVKLDFIRPGKPVENTYVESFNGKVRYECLNQHYFTSLEEAKRTIEAWRVRYNEFRPHKTLGGLTPQSFAAKFQDQNNKHTLENSTFSL